MDLIEDQTAAPPPPPTPEFDLGAWAGKTQAFGLIAARSSAARAECLKRIRDGHSHDSLGLSWEQFCQEHAGISRSYADKLIQRLDEFGAAYFELSQIARVSPESYRRLAPSVTPEGIEIAGETLPLTPEHAPRIRQAIQALTLELRKAKAATQLPSIAELQRRLEACLQEMSIMAVAPRDRGTHPALRGLIHYFQNRLKRVAQSVPAE